MYSIQADWGGTVKLTWDPAIRPPLELITSVHSFCFQDNQLLLVKLNHRGWDFPGGHVEKEETVEQALNRELMEEAYIEGEHKRLGCIIVDHCENMNWNESSPYPKIGYQVFYRTTITHMHPFNAEHESKE